jgi:uncharacterized protein
MTQNNETLLSSLLKVSKIDVALATILAEKKKIEDGLRTSITNLKKQDTERQQKQKVHDEKKNRYNKEEKRLRDEREKLIARRKSLTSLNNYKLQQAAEKEIEHAARQISSQEEALLVTLDDFEKLAVEIKKHEDAIAEIKTEYDKASIEAKATLANLEERSTVHITEREQLTKSVDAKALGIYERIRDKYLMNPVVEVQNASCSGCFMQLGPQVVVQISRGDTIVRCPGCGRMLYMSQEQPANTAN